MEHQRIRRLSKRDGALFCRYHKQFHQINRQTVPSSWQNRSHQAVLAAQRHLPTLLHLEERSRPGSSGRQLSMKMKMSLPLQRQILPRRARRRTARRMAISPTVGLLPSSRRDQPESRTVGLSPSNQPESPGCPRSISC